MPTYQFTDLFDLGEIQRLQDLLAEATGVASLITDPSGRPITRPSGFCRLCRDVIRSTPRGRANCMRSDAAIGASAPDGPTVRPCLSGGLWDGGASIHAGDSHLANWLVGQVLTDEADPESMLAYADEIGADRAAFAEALEEVPRMPEARFRAVCQFVHVLAGKLSDLARTDIEQRREIGERLRAEKALRQSEEIYKTVAQFSSDFSYWRGPDGQALYVSPACQPLTGYPPEAFLRQPDLFDEIVHPDDRAFWDDHVRQAPTACLSRPLEIRIVTRTGQTRWVNHICRPVYDDSGRYLGTRGSNRDITERKRAEESQVQLGRILEKSLNEIFIFDFHTLKFVQVNDSARRNLGYGPEELRELTPVDIKPEFTAEQFDDALAPLRDGRQRSLRFETVHRRRDGSTYPVEICLQVGLYDGRKVYVAIVLDVSERKRAEDALRRSEKRFRDLAMSLADCLWETDAEGRFTYCSNRIRDLLGYAPAEVLGQTAFDFMVSEDAPAARNAFGRAVAGKRAFRDRETWNRHRDGHRVCLLSSGVPVFNAAGEVAGYRGVDKDVTERKRAEQELRRAMEAADAAAEAKGEFLANMSHEIRTPMNGVLGMAELLAATELSDEQRTYAETISQSANALLTVINDILDFSKIQAGRLELHEAPFDCQTAVDDIGQLLAPQAEEKGINLVVRYAPDAPRFLVGDAGRFRQVVMNLVSNAIKFTERGHVLIDVQCLARSDASATIRVRVEDTGIGIPDDAIDRIFEKFTQADSTPTRMFGGTGLGLAISQCLVHMMGGEIGLTSRLDAGSTFYFTVTLDLAPDAPGQTLVGEELVGVRTLVVDDHSVNRRVLTELFDAWDIPCTAVPDGESALRELFSARQANDPYRMVILDNHMDGMDGESLARAIHASDELAGTVLIMLSSIGSSAGPDRLHELGLAACLNKPVRASRLLDAMLAAWAARRQGEPVVAVRVDRRTRRTRNRGPVPAGNFHARVLLAEDKPTNQKVASTILQRLGCHVDLAINGAEALDAVQRESYDLVFMDCQMPLMDGFEATRRIRQLTSQARNTTIVAMTANVMAGDREACLHAGMNDYVAKPVSQQAIHAVLSKYCPAGPEQRRELVLKALIAEEDPDVLAEIARVVRRVCPGATLRTATNGVETCALLGSFLPDLLVTNLAMPEVDGAAVIRHVQENPRYAGTRVLVITALTEDHPRLQQARRLSKVDALVRKPLAEGELVAVLERVLLAPQAEIGKAEAPSPPDRQGAVEEEDEPVLDPTVVRDSIGDEPETVREFVSLFLADLPPEIDELAFAIDNGQPETIERRAHAIKGAAGDVGGKRLRRAAWRIEQAARQRQPADYPTLLSGLRNEWSHLLQAMRHNQWTDPADPPVETENPQ